MSDNIGGCLGSMSLKDEVLAAIAGSWKLFLGVGIISFLLGNIAIILPFAVSLAIEILIGSILVVSGFSRLIHSLKFKKILTLEMLTSFIAIILGVLMLWHPWEGMLVLTVMLACFFIATGVFRILWAMQLRPTSSWVWILGSGVVTLILGLIVWSGLPGDAEWVLGILLGIDLIVGGVSLIAFSIAVRKMK